MPKMTRIDFHTHILPDVDDGPKDGDTAVQMLRMMAAYSVDTVVATPHYFSLDESPGDFVQRVQRSRNLLCDSWKRIQGDTPMPRILFGAEVYLERNLLLTEDLTQLCITGTDLLMLELPLSAHRDWICPLITNLSAVLGVRPVIAHVERILSLISKADLSRLLEIPGVAFQFNHTAFANRRAMRFLLGLLKAGYPVFFGSDCHDAVRRPPTSEQGFAIVEDWLNRKMGREFLEQISWVQQCELKLTNNILP